MTNTMSMSSLVQIVKDIRNNSEQIEYVLMNTDDFAEMVRNDDLRHVADIAGHKPPCIFGISIRTSEYIRQGDICKVLKHVSIR